MNNPKKMNPDNATLQQLEGHWQKVAMMILWKLSPDGRVKISADEIEAFGKHKAPGVPCLVSHGHFDSMEFYIVDEAAARVMMEHEKTQRGTA